MTDGKKYSDGPAMTAGPSVEEIGLIHRHGDFVSFHRDAEGIWEDLYAIQTLDIKEWFPQLMEHLMRDSYFTISGFGPGKRRESYVPGLRLPNRKKDNVKWLNSLYVDIDNYRLKVSMKRAIGRVFTIAADLQLPEPSIISDSGRGFWVHWLLGDPKQSEPATPENIGLWALCARRLYDIFADIGADPAATKDVTRVTRVPGSINTKVNKRVLYNISFTSRNPDLIITHSLDHMADALGIESQARAYMQPVEPIRRRRQGTPDPAKRSGWAALQQYRLSDFQTLQDMRNGFRDGHRHLGLFVGAAIMYAAGIRDDKLCEQLQRIAARCKPQVIAEYRITNVIKQVTESSPCRMTDDYIADSLRITPTEAAALLTFKPATRHPRPEPPEPRKVKASRRRQLIRKHIRSIGGVPALRKIQSWLEDNHGIRVALRTVKTDLERMKIENPRRWGKKDENQVLMGATR